MPDAKLIGVNNIKDKIQEDYISPEKHSQITWHGKDLNRGNKPKEELLFIYINNAYRYVSRDVYNLHIHSLMN